MTPSTTTPAQKSTYTAENAVAGFRLVEDQLSDASGNDSDRDQSAHSERDLSPTRPGAAVSKSKKRRLLKQERRQVGAITDELDSLLGVAFQETTDSSAPLDIASGNAEIRNVDQAMEVEPTPDWKKMSKRTRQNLIKMEKRKMARERQQSSQFRQQPAAVDQKSMAPSEKLKHQRQSKKNSTQARRLRKEKERARKAGTEAMEIG
ncbi:hypothetical protein EK21DRAFT_87764 [Setomelanomma holmii]|uniref:Uncharacterized protein n=1 Tax=Setomelanomma holmii TaxID=210430 RepID=A0A9P4LN69_9PLEO|nr:hypothetical protein EK21DRAFT_87764 [Setomelanomma holmii]